MAYRHSQIGSFIIATVALGIAVLVASVGLTGFSRPSSIENT